MTTSLLAAWWGPLIPVGMVVVVILYSALQAAARRKPWTDTPPPVPSPLPDGDPWGRGSPFPRPQPFPGIPPLARPAGSSAGAGPGRPAPLPAFPALPPVLASLSEDAPAEQASIKMPLRIQEAADSAMGSEGSPQARVQERMHRVDLRMQRPMATPVPGRAPRNNPAVASLIRRLHSPASAREAWISAMIFAPPRSLE